MLSAVDIADLDARVPSWLDLPEAADRLGIGVAGVRRLIDDADLVAVKRGSPPIRSVPEVLVTPQLLNGLAGTVTVLRDSGYDDIELLAWLFTAEPGEPSPLELLRTGRKTEVRRRAQVLAF